MKPYLYSYRNYKMQYNSHNFPLHFKHFFFLSNRQKMNTFGFHDTVFIIFQITQIQYIMQATNKQTNKPVLTFLFTGLTGNIVIDDQGDRLLNFWMLDMQPSGKFKTILELEFTKSGVKYTTEVIISVFYINQLEWDFCILFKPLQDMVNQLDEIFMCRVK